MPSPVSPAIKEARSTEPRHGGARHSRGTGPSGTPAALDRTRQRLIEAAGEVFAEAGYEAATVREICARAGANVAAVNYHFGDKLELYTEVLRQSVGAVHDETVRHALDQEGPPEAVLRQAVRVMLQRMCPADRPDLRFRLIMHELVHPTEAIARVIDEVMRPIYDRLRGIIGAILKLPRDHEKTRLCTQSVIGQIVHYARSRPVLTRLWPELKMTPEQLEKIADHIAEFSLAYMRASRPPAGRRK